MFLGRAPGKVRIDRPYPVGHKNAAGRQQPHREALHHDGPILQVSLLAQEKEQPQRRAPQQKSHQVIGRQLYGLALNPAKAEGQADQQVAYRQLAYHPRQRRQV